MALTRAVNILCAQGFDWLNNNQGDNPCTVASSILKQSDPNQTFTLSPITPGQSYLSPSAQQADTYLCNTVIYSLVSACATCQNGTFQTYSQWSSNCPTDRIQPSGRFPNQTVLLTPLPSYASFPLTSNGSWDRMSVGGVLSFFSAVQTATTPKNSSTSWDVVITVIVVTILVICITSLGGICFYFKRHRSALPVYHPIWSQPNRPLSHADGSEESHTVVEESMRLSGPRSRWFPLNINIPFLRYLKPSTIGRVSPYDQGFRRTNSHEDTAPRKPAQQLNRHTHPTAPPSSPPSMSQLNAKYREPRPQPQRIDTFPLVQSITRPRPATSRANSVPNIIDTNAASRPVDLVVNVSKPRNFRIEDTPTTTDGFPAFLKHPGLPKKQEQIFNPIISTSVTSFASSFASRHERQGSVDDSDSLLSLPRSQRRLGPSAPSHKAPSTSASSRSAASVVSFDDDFLSSEATVGSFPTPRSARLLAVPSSKDPSKENDLYRYGDNQSRTRLFPAAVRAAGYTGIPHKAER